MFVLRNAAHFQFLTDGNEYYVKLNIHSATEISRAKRVVRRESKLREQLIQTPRESLSTKAPSHVINTCIFAVRAPQRRPYVTGAHSTVRIQTTTH
jgi:hypothetical protein